MIRKRTARNDVLVAATVSAAGIFILLSDGAGLPAAAGMVLVGLAPLACSRAPQLAPGLLAAAVWLNGWLFGVHVRCGAFLPAMAWVLFAGYRRAWGAADHSLLAVSAVACLAGEAAYDPIIVWNGGLPLAVVMAALAAVFGHLQAGYDRGCERLREQTRELLRSEERTLQLAAQAERLRLGADVHAAVEARLDDIRGHVAHLQTRPSRRLMPEEFTQLEQAARGVLDAMRQILTPVRPPAGSADR